MEEEVNKFVCCLWCVGFCGMLIFDDVVVWFIGRMVSCSDVGDYVVYLLEFVSVWVLECLEDLFYFFDFDFDVDDIDFGKEVLFWFYECEWGDEIC